MNHIPRADSRANVTTIRRWLAVQSRAPDPNAAFCYGVTTTQIYCRPTRPGRVARRANVVFFDSSALVRTAGYRACRRCEPGSADWSREAHCLELVRRGQDIIVNAVRLGLPWTVDNLAQRLHISAAHSHGLFRKHLGVTPGMFAQNVSNSQDNIAEARPGLQCFESLETQVAEQPVSAVLTECFEKLRSGDDDELRAVNELAILSSPNRSHLLPVALLLESNMVFENWLFFEDDVP